MSAVVGGKKGGRGNNKAKQKAEIFSAFVNHHIFQSNMLYATNSQLNLFFQQFNTKLFKFRNILSHCLPKHL